MQLTTAPENGTVPKKEQPAQKAVLLVAPSTLLLEAGKLLLSPFCRSVQTAGACVDVSNLSQSEEPQFVILSDQLGTLHLQAVAELVRHRWPRARITVVGRAALLLEDQLYDEAVVVTPTDLGFLAVLEDCVRRSEWAKATS